MHCRPIRDRALAALAAAICASAAQAQAPAYPTKPIRMIIALAPGGGVDTTGRIIAQKLGESWGQSFVADNRPGAGGTIAADAVARAAPDGYTVLMTSSGLAITPSIMKLPYDPAKDLLPVTMAVVSPGVLVTHPSIPVKNVKELVAFAKTRPEQLLYSSSGLGSAQHLSIELFNQMTGLKMTHIPYKGTAPSITDLVGGRVALTVASVISTRPFFTTGKLRALAVVGPKRTPALPEYPTIAESGVPGFGVENWYALFMPGATNKAIATKVQAAVTRLVHDPEMRKTLLAQGLDAVGSSQEQFTKDYHAEIAKWSRVVKSVGVQLN
ncbi:MAG: tripartite tricarboxylate transporter substrate binding protein [Betaproteobacteria bacterium]|nr:tripartite tricarboxylate transporter substrate binding protein [Betaproteobacteria bacterium]